MDLGFSIRVLVLAWTQVETAMSAITRIRQFLNDTPQEPVAPNEFTHPLWPMSGEVQFRDVSSSYSQDPSAPAALRHINLHIAAGERIGVCGRTGSGKSSLIATLLGLLHQTAGEIIIDGVRISTVPWLTLRQRIVTLTQDSFFLDKSVRNNLAPWACSTEDEDENAGYRVSDDEMVRALKTCHIWDKLAAAAPDDGSGLDVNLEAVDTLLSQGEKQLLCLARGILHPGRIVLLDEITSRSVIFLLRTWLRSLMLTLFAESMNIRKLLCRRF